ncbi:MAG: hypothetical protein ACREJ4_16740, partial [Candidatus Methylomirabilaceae bacterium]
MDDRHVRKDVLKAARAALLDYFAFEQMAFARPIHLSDIYSVLQNSRGVVSVDIDVLHLKGYSGWTPTQRAARGVTAAAVQEHIRIFEARPHAGTASIVDPVVLACFASRPIPEVLPAEQAF